MIAKGERISAESVAVDRADDGSLTAIEDGLQELEVRWPVAPPGDEDAIDIPRIAEGVNECPSHSQDDSGRGTGERRARPL